MVRHRPAAEPPAPEVEDGGQVEPALARGHVGDVPAVALVRRTGREVLADEVRKRRGEVVPDRRTHAPAGRDPRIMR